MGQFGNQLFQYAYLRTMAHRLGVQFYCPSWVGDKIFRLHDKKERSHAPSGITKTYNEPEENDGFLEEAFHLQDGTDVCGFFQSEKYFDKDEAGLWFSFNERIIQIKEKFKHIDFSQSVSLSLRIGDDYNARREKHPLYPPVYYEKALDRVHHTKHILVFSDRPDRARKYFSKLRSENWLFMEGMNQNEDLYLMSQCHDNIITNSTFSWWGAWLNRHADKVVILPEEWYRPGHPRKNSDIACQNWIEMRSLHPVFDHYTIWYFFFRVKRKIKTILSKIKINRKHA